jgi:hypothetical protein
MYLGRIPLVIRSVFYGATLCSCQERIKRIKSEFICWYMDAGTLGGIVDTLLEDFNLIIDEGRKLGLKCRQHREV